MRRRLLVGIAALSLLIPGAASAVEPATGEYQPIPLDGPIDPAVLPNALDDSRQVDVMVEMSGDPVAVVESRAPGRQLSRAQKDAIKAELRGRQDAIRDEIAARGGSVQSQLQSAYNGIRVRIARNEVSSLLGLPNVVGVHGLQVHTIDNDVAVPFIGAPTVWENSGFTGDGIRVAVIDTGIDFTHANFGGSGDPRDFERADRQDTMEPRGFDSFGPDAPKVKGGFDFVGDDYNASSDDPAETVPHPDPNPLDCHGHGSHVAGSAVGFGVSADGTTFTGPYDASTHENEFRIGPGVAPEADLYALRVFGCTGSTNVTVDAIDWAVDNDMDVINMSLGASFGRAEDPSAVASTNAAAAGIIVVASAGNSGPSPYISGSPAAGAGAISTAAIDSTASFPGVNLALDTGGDPVVALNANAAAITDGQTLPIVVLQDDPATADEDESLGCSLEAFQKANVGGALAVSVRGVCARVARAIYGEQAGAAAVAMINTDPGYPPFEGPITSNPDTGEDFEVTIPFLGIRGVLGSGGTDDGDRLVAAGTATLSATTIDNPGFRGFASFSSGGPRNGDSALKPDIAAPGVSIQSTLIASGTEGTRISGTSMAAPMVAGVAALVAQAHPDWSPEETRAAIVNTGDPAGMDGHRVSRAGTGLVQPVAATSTSVVALGDVGANVDGTDFHTGNLSFGFSESETTFSATRTITLRNKGTSDFTYDVAVAGGGSVSLSTSSVTVPGGGEASVEVTLSVSPTEVGDSSPTAANRHAFREVAGLVSFTAEGQPTLRVPYYLVPRASSDLAATLDRPFNASGRSSVTVRNTGAISGEADFYAWGLSDGDDVDEEALGGTGYDVRSVGVQSFDVGGGDRLLVFAVNTHARWSNASVNELDVLLDTDGDGSPDMGVIGFDIGAILAGAFDGRYGSFTIDLETGQVLAAFFASAPTDGTTALLPAFASDLGITAENPRFTYTSASFSLEGAGFDAVDGSAEFNAFTPAVSTGQFVSVAPGASAKVTVTVDSAEFAETPALGFMVVTHDDASGAAEADLVEAVFR